MKLSRKEKEIAANVYKTLINKKRYLMKKMLTLSKIKNKLFELGVSKIDYIEVLDINKLVKPYRKIKKYKIFIAYYLQSTRLIDNI